MKPLNTITLHQVDHAASDEELLALLRRYVREVPAHAIARFPPGCVPHDLRDSEDIADWAIRLTQCRIIAGEDFQPLIEMEQLFGRACVRVSQLLDRTGKWRYHARPRENGSGGH